MIYLKFEDTVQACDIPKPRFETTIERVLKNFYSDNLANEYSKELSDYIRMKMKFPENGIYRMDKETFFKFNTKNDQWIDTNESPQSYVIEFEDQMWHELLHEKKYFTSCIDEVKAVVKEETKNMFTTVIWQSIGSIDSKSMVIRPPYSIELLKNKIQEYFAPNRTEEIFESIYNILFNITEKNYVILFENGIVKKALRADKAISPAENILSNLQNLFEADLKPEHSKTLAIFIKNLIFYNYPGSKFEAISFDEKENIPYVIYKGLKVAISDDKLFIKMETKEIFNIMYSNFDKGMNLKSLLHNEECAIKNQNIHIKVKRDHSYLSVFTCYFSEYYKKSKMHWKLIGDICCDKLRFYNQCACKPIFVEIE